MKGSSAIPQSLEYVEIINRQIADRHKFQKSGGEYGHLGTNPLVANTRRASRFRHYNRHDMCP